ELPRLARRLARLRRPRRLVRDLARGGRILFERLGELVVDDLLDEALDVAVAELRLRLTLELRIGDADRHDGAQAFADVVARQAALEVLEEAVGFGVRRDAAGERRAEAGQMRAALARVDVVREGEHALLIAVVVLERDLDLDVA